MPKVRRASSLVVVREETSELVTACSVSVGLSMEHSAPVDAPVFCKGLAPSLEP